jgi:hypothetical protein
LLGDENRTGDFDPNDNTRIGLRPAEEPSLIGDFAPLGYDSRQMLWMPRTDASDARSMASSSKGGSIRTS